MMTHGTDPSNVTTSTSSPWVEMPRSVWAELAANTSMSVNTQTIESLRGVGDPTDDKDIQEIYLPLTQLIGEYIRNTQYLYRDSNHYLGRSVSPTPFVIAIAGSVAVGKSTVARLLEELLRRGVGRPKVQLITTDGYLFPNSVLEDRGILDRKGFPESYDTKALLQFVVDVKSGQPLVQTPVYSHTSYDIVPGQFTTVSHPDILIVEGLNVLQPASSAGHSQALSVNDFIDFSVYVDADEADIHRWFTNRFLRLRATAFNDPSSFFIEFAKLSDHKAIEVADQVWDETNGPNLRDNIEPTKQRATVILRKGCDHHVESVRIRKI